jgi:hypothetical protein
LCQSATSHLREYIYLTCYAIRVFFKINVSLGQKNRPGTALDIRAMKVAMGLLDFRTLTFKDLTVAEIRRTIAYIAQVQHAFNSSLKVV